MWADQQWLWTDPLQGFWVCPYVSFLYLFFFFGDCSGSKSPFGDWRSSEMNSPVAGSLGGGVASKIMWLACDTCGSVVELSGSEEVGTKDTCRSTNLAGQTLARRRVWSHSYYVLVITGPGISWTVNWPLTGVQSLQTRAVQYMVISLPEHIYVAYMKADWKFVSNSGILFFSCKQ